MSGLDVPHEFIVAHWLLVFSCSAHIREFSASSQRNDIKGTHGLDSFILTEGKCTTVAGTECLGADGHRGNGGNQQTAETQESLKL